jgi:hypothetical protein
MMNRWSRILGIVVTLVLFAGIALVATSPPRASAQLPPRDQTDADVLYLDNQGEYVLAWSEDRGAGHRLFARRIRSNGLPLGGAAGGEWELTGATQPGDQKGDQRWPALVDGLVVWSERAPGGADYDLYAQKLFGNARGNGHPKLIAGGAGDQKQADVIQTRDNEWLVVWSEDTRDTGDVMGLRLGTTLAPRGGVIEIAKGGGVAEDPTVALDLLESNLALVLWADDRKGNLDIYGARVAITGLPRGTTTGSTPFAVVDGAENDYAPVLLTSPFQRNVGPTATPTPRSNRPGGPGWDVETRNLLLWTHDDVTDGPDVLAIRLQVNGYTAGALIPVAVGPGVQKWPAAALKSGDGSRGEWLAVWHADPLGTLDVFGVEIGQNGLVRRHPRALATD